MSQQNKKKRAEYEKAGLLDDIPQVAVGAEAQQAIGRRHRVEGGRLLVAEEDVGHPDLVPREVRQLHGADVGVGELQARVVP